MGIWKSTSDVFIQSNTSNPFRAFLQTYDKIDITLTSAIDLDDYIISVSAGHGITAGDILIIYSNNYFWQVIVLSVDTNDIILGAPSYIPFSVVGTTIIRGKRDLNVEGTLEAPIDFKFGIPSVHSNPIDISKAIITMGYSVSQGDDGDFGNLTALTNGVLLRKSNAVTFNLGVYRNNQDFKLLGADVTYIDSAPAGDYGLDIVFNIQGQENFDQVIRLYSGGFIHAYVRDDITDLNNFKISLIGSYTTGE